MNSEHLPDPASFCVDGRKVISLARYRRLIGYDWKKADEAIDSWERYDRFIKEMPIEHKLISVERPMTDDLVETCMDALLELEERFAGLVTYRACGSYVEICCADPRDLMLLRLKLPFIAVGRDEDIA